MFTQGQTAKFIASKVAPKERVATYWVDLSSCPYGRVIKVWAGDDWVMIGSTDTVVIESVTKEVKANLQGYVYDPMYVHTDHNFTTQLLHKVAELDVKLKALEARLAATDVSIVKLTPTRPPKATAAPTEGPTLAPVVKVTLPPRAKSKAPKVKSWFNQLPSGYNVTF